MARDCVTQGIAHIYDLRNDKGLLYQAVFCLSSLVHEMEQR